MIGFIEEFSDARIKQLREWEENIKNWALLRDIVEFHWQKEFPDGDLLIRVVRKKALKAESTKITPEICEISVIGE